MADPVASVERIVKIGLKIKETVDTLRQNKRVCQQINNSVLTSNTILSQLQKPGMMDNNPAMSCALDDLEGTLERALELIDSYPERCSICRFIVAGDLAKQLQEAKDDIQHKVSLATFSAVILLMNRASGHPLPQQREYAGVEVIPHNSRSNDEDARHLANPVAITGRTINIGPQIKKTVDNVRHKEDVCQQISDRVFKSTAILSQLHQSAVMDKSQVVNDALEDLKKTLTHAQELVGACQKRSTTGHLIVSGDLSKQLLQVKDDILNKVMLASSSINAHTTILMSRMPPRQLEDKGVVAIRHYNRSTYDASLVAIVERIVRIGVRIREAVDTVRHNEELCQQINSSVLKCSAILSELHRTGAMDKARR